MNKPSTLLLVAIVSAGGGAAVMWLVSRGPGSPSRSITDSPIREKIERRQGIPEPFHGPPTSADLEAGSRRVDPAALAQLARPPVKNGSIHADGDRSGTHSDGEGGSRGITATFAKTQSGTQQTQTLSSNRWNAARSSALNQTKVNEALTAALRAAGHFTKEGYTTRDDYWGGVLDRSPKAVVHQLFRGNEYWFWLGADRRQVGIDVHIYDSDGNLAESEHWQQDNVAAARVTPVNTGAYYIIVSAKAQEPQKESANMPVHWALAYGYR